MSSFLAVVGDDLGEAGRAGTLMVTHSQVRGSELALAELRLLSSEVDGSTLHVQQLLGDDVQFIRSDMTVTEATLAAIDLRSSALRGCTGGVLIAGSKVSKSRLSCEGKLQIYTTPVDMSAVDGELELHISAFADGTLGLEHPTGITSWESSLDNMVFCDAADRLHASATILTCVDCEGPLAEPEPDACIDPENAGESKTNVCDALQMPPLCDGFAPPRRPIDGF